MVINREDFDIDSYLAFLLAKASHSVSSALHEQLRSKGVSIGTWRILAVLSGGSRTVSELASMVLLNQSTLSKALDKLEQQGLVVRERDPSARRQVNLSITDEGEAFVVKMLPLMKSHERQSFAHLNSKEQRQLVALLQKTIVQREH